MKGERVKKEFLTYFREDRHFEAFWTWNQNAPRKIQRDKNCQVSAIFCQ